MVIADTVNPAVRVYGEGHTVQAPSADDTAKAGWVVTLPTSLQDLMEQSNLSLIQHEITQHICSYIYSEFMCIYHVHD